MMVQARVAELVDAHDSKSCSARSGGSIPSTGTTQCSQMFAVVRKSRKNRDLADDVFAVVCQNAPIAGPIVGIFVGTSKAATTRCQHDGADRHGDPHEQAARKIVQAYQCSWVASVNGTDRRQALAVCLPICRQADIGAW